MAPRLAFVHTRSKFGRLRMLIDRINGFAAARGVAGGKPPSDVVPENAGMTPAAATSEKPAAKKLR